MRFLLISFLLLLPCTLPAWQQRVHYTMEIDLKTETHSYTGKQRLVYYNNSPDTIREVYYHLYYEAFKPGSMMDVRDRSIPGSWMKINELPPAWQGGIRVDQLKQNGRTLEWSVRETILRADLHAPLLPGDSTVLEMAWETRIPKLRRRGGWLSSEGVEFSMAQWYPKLAEYDRNGWHPDEYVAREFYGVYGTFDVSITLPATYVVGGTGTVMNPEEVGCGYQLGMVDTVLKAPASGTGMKTWRFHAENVHDFAWAADREYIHHITRWENVRIHILVKKQYAPIWENTRLWTRALMAYFSRRFGRYDYPQFTIAQGGDGGMEYPQFILITGNRTGPSLAGVIAHELGHQWYYGMIGNNETQEAWLDEGFTQYLTNEASREVFGIQLGPNPYQGLDRMVYPWIEERWINTENAYELAVTGYDEPLDTYHDRFRENITGGLPYYRGEAVLKMIQYMFGDTLFDRAMRHYYAEWKFRHPTARDFERAMEEASGMRLDWFFSQWVGTTRLLDYAIDALSSEPSPEGGYTTTLSLSNRNEAEMPLDILLVYEDDSTAIANVPVQEWKKPGVAFHLPRWRWVERTYTASFITPKRVKRAIIDTSTLLFDIDRTNNMAATGLFANILPPTKTAFYRRWDFGRPLDAYSIRLRPTLWYSQADGAQIGFVADGGYAFDRYNAKLGGYYNIGSKRIDYDIRYNTSIGLIGRLGRISLLATNADGVQRWGASVEKTIKPYFYSNPVSQKLTLRTEREVLVGGNYPNAVAPWNGGGYNTISLGYSVAGNIAQPSIALRGATEFDASFASASEFTQWRITGSAFWNTWGLTIGSELFAGASLGVPPAQRLFNATGATSRDMHLNPMHRLFMNIRPEFAARNHLVLPTQGYLLSFAGADTSIRLAENLINIRLSAGNLNPFSRIVSIPFLNRFDLRLYAAGGWLFHDQITFRGFSDFNFEAGMAAEIDLLGALLPQVLIDAIDAPAPLRLGFHAPLFTSSKLLGDDGLRYRWALSVSL